MSAARIRSAMAPSLEALGFERHGSEFSLLQPELEHVVSVFAIRRLSGFFEVVHSVFARDAGQDRASNGPALVRDRIRGYSKPYLDAWEWSRFDPVLAAKQVSAVLTAFGSLGDVAHFRSDRWTDGSALVPNAPVSSSVPIALSREDEERVLGSHSRAIFGDRFFPASRLGAEIWAHDEEVGGYRYCTYLQPNDAATFAVVMYFAFASDDVERGRGSAEVLRLLYCSRKQLLSDAGQPVLIPLIGGAVDPAQVAATLLRALAVAAPNALPRDES